MTKQAYVVTVQTIANNVPKQSQHLVEGAADQPEASKRAIRSLVEYQSLCTWKGPGLCTFKDGEKVIIFRAMTVQEVDPQDLSVLTKYIDSVA